MSECGCPSDQADALERKTLVALLTINAAMFVVEAVAGWWAESTGLLADSLDMLADAAVYATALYAVGRAMAVKARAATLSGWMQIILGIGVLLEVIRRYVTGSEPVSSLMIGVGLLALAANVSCMALLAKHRQGGVHMRASWIFSTNDVIANTGVILSGLLVMYLESPLPDLLIGAIIAAVVIRGGTSILREARAELAEAGGSGASH